MIKCLSTTMLGRNVHGIGTLIMGLVLAGLVLLNTLDRAGATTTPPQGPTTLVIQKFQQPEHSHEPASGLPLDEAQVAEHTPVADVNFAVSKVPDMDVTTEQGRAAANELTVRQAAERLADGGPAASGTTNNYGELVFSDLEAGLYFVEETAAPAGVITTDPFLVMLPMPHPTQDSWLQTVYVYPKNSALDISLSVVDEATIQTGDDIDWHIAAEIPKQTSLSTYRIRNMFAPGIALKQQLSAVQVALSTGASLQTDRDYALEARLDDGHEGFELTFTEAGREKLVEARQHDSTAQLTVDYTAPATSSGSHTNTVELQVDDAQAITDSATTQLGTLEAVLHERDRPDRRIENAVFELYLSAEDALASRNPVPVGDSTQWRTDAHGTFTIDGLRLTNFVNGLEHDRHDPLYRLYYLKPVEYPTGWIGEKHPVAVALTSADEPHQLTFEVVSSDNQAAASGDDGSSQDLASTGPRIAGLVLVALIFIAVGSFALRRRQHRRRPTV